MKFAKLFVGVPDVCTGGCLLSREKAVNDVNSHVEFCFLVGVRVLTKSFLVHSFREHKGTHLILFLSFRL